MSIRIDFTQCLVRFFGIGHLAIRDWGHSFGFGALMSSVYFQPIEKKLLPIMHWEPKISNQKRRNFNLAQSVLRCHPRAGNCRPVMQSEN